MLSFAFLVAFMGVAEPSEPSLKIAILNISPKAGFDRERVELFDEFLQNELRERGFQVVSRTDIEATLGLEKLRDALGCDSLSCMVEIGGALGVDELVTGAIGKLDPYLMITLKRISPRDGRVLKQTVRKLPDAGDRQLVDSIPPLVDELYGARPVPAPPGLGAADAGSAPAAGSPPVIPALPTPARSAPVADIAALSQGMQFKVVHEADSFSVTVKTATETIACAGPVTFLTPCALVLPPGPAVVQVPSREDHSLVVPSGRTIYAMQYPDYTWSYVGLGLIGGGAVLAVTALLLPFPEKHDSDGATIDADGDGQPDKEWGSVKLATLIAGGVLAYGGIILGAVGLFGNLGERPQVHPYEGPSPGAGAAWNGLGLLPLPGGAAVSTGWSF